jgi:hypothetical protein
MAAASLQVGLGELGIPEIYSWTLPTNLFSQRVMEKRGFRYERDFGTRPVRPWHYPMAIQLPLLGVIPGGLVATILRKLLDVRFLSGVE